MGTIRARLLGEWNELAGRDQPQIVVHPTQQGLHAHQLSIRDIDQRLIEQNQLIPLDRPSQVGFQIQSLEHGLVHRLGIELKVVSTLPLGAIHGGLGTLQQ